MKKRKKLLPEELEGALIADADNPAAWEEPVTVPASRSPRAAWYGGSKHLELAAKFYILSVLHRLGAEANITYAQPDNVDIAAVRQSGQAFTIDVKTLAGTKDWRVDNFRAHKHHYIAFVCFERDWHDPRVVPEIYIWESEKLRSLVDREKTKSVSLEALGSKLDPMLAWEQFTTEPAA